MKKKHPKIEKMNPQISLGIAIRFFRSKANISQEELGFRADLHRTFISDIERGARNPTVTTLWKIAKALEVLPSKIVRKSEETLSPSDWNFEK